MAERTLFARKSTGLVREIGLTVAIMVPMANAIGVGWQLRVFQGMGWFPVARSQWFLGLPPVTMAFLITGIGCLLSVYAFAVVTAAMPRAGGGYVAISRILSPLWGMVATLFQWMGVSAAYGQIAVFVMEAIMIFGGFVGILSVGYFGTPVGLFVFSLFVIAFFSAVAALGARQTGRLLQVIFWIPAAILALVVFLFLIASPSTMAAGTQAQFGASPTAYIQQALDTGLAEAAGPYWPAVIGTIIATYWAFIGYATTNFIAGEMKEASRNLPKAMLIATAVITAVYLVVSFLLVRAGGIAGVVQGFDLVGATAWMTFGGGSYGDLTGIGPWMPVFAQIQGVGMGIGALTGWATLFFAVLWAANDIPPFILATSRMLFAMAFDRVLPEGLANVDERWHSPINAIIATSVVALLGAAGESGLFSEAGIYLGAAFKTFMDGFGMMGSNLWDAIFYFSFAVAAFAFPIVKPEIFERAPFRASKTVVQVIGALAVLANLFFLYIFIFNERSYNLLGLLQNFTFAGFSVWLATIIIVVVGAGFYYYYRSQAAVTGVDYTTIFAEIPPE
ncbi:MAG: APC family permease [Anaerolineae bacterium]